MTEEEPFTLRSLMTETLSPFFNRLQLTSFTDKSSPPSFRESAIDHSCAHSEQHAPNYHKNVLKYVEGMTVNRSSDILILFNQQSPYRPEMFALFKRKY